MHAAALANADAQDVADQDAESSMSPDDILSLGATLRGEGKPGEAANVYREVLREFAGLHHALAALELGRNHFDAAIPLLEVAAYLRPDAAHIHGDLARALVAVGFFGEAKSAADRAVALSPESATAHDTSGLVGMANHEYSAAQRSFEAAVFLDDTVAARWLNLGTARLAQGLLTTALDAVARARSLHPTFVGAAEAHVSLLFQLGRFADAREAVRTAPPAARPSLIVSLADSEADPVETARAFRASAARYVQPSAAPHVNDRDPARRLRVGYISGDFREHSIASFIGPVLAAHDRDEVEAWCYYNDGTIDAATSELRARADQFKLVRMLSDEQLDKLVRDDEIDILVDLSGATGGHRLGLLGRKPAPIQVCAIGYPAAVDAYITDPYCDPPGMTDALYDEELVRLPATFQCFEPHMMSPFIEQLPALRLGHVTFASFHSYWKLSEATIDTWARVLAAVPGSRILFKSTASPDSALRECSKVGSRSAASQRRACRSPSSCRAARRASRPTGTSTSRSTPFRSTAPPPPASRSGWASPS
jgi:predicted O-linked N-acetylglucosamine transferase (SPINDLY family)